MNTSVSTSSAHTPGTWIVQNRNEICAKNEHESLIAEVFEQADNWRANARLIAAAPILLETLETLSDWCESNRDDVWVGQRGTVATVIREAIAKANVKDRSGLCSSRRSMHERGRGWTCCNWSGIPIPYSYPASQILYVLQVDDAQMLAAQRVGRSLTHDELLRVKRNFEWGIGEQWAKIMEIAIDEALRP